jgi:hypothetical protein
MPDNDQRSNLKDLLIFCLASVIAAILMFSDYGKNQGRIYDCRDAHWHPDYPPEVKEECRRLIREHFEKNKQEEIERKQVIT